MGTDKVVGTLSENIKLISGNVILTFSCMSTHRAITPIQRRKRRSRKKRRKIRNVADLEDFRKISDIFSQVLIEMWKRKTWLFTQRLSLLNNMKYFSLPRKQHIKSLSLRHSKDYGFWFPIVVVILGKDEKNKYCQFNE